MNVDKDNNFFKLNIDEVENKLTAFAKDNSNITLWKQDGKKQRFRVKSFDHLNGEYCLKLFSEGSDIDISICFGNIFYHFEVNKLAYFGESKVNPGEEEDTLELYFQDYVFRAEKRSTERLLTFPHYQVYVYYNLDNNVEIDNVISIGQTLERNLKDRKFQQKKEVMEKLSETTKSDIDSLCGFRILDVSKTGAAFLVDATESKFFIENEVSNIHISFEDDIFNIPDAKIVYNVDYLSGSTSKKNKIGIKFSILPRLREKIINILNKDNHDDVIFKDFEKFYKK